MLKNKNKFKGYIYLLPALIILAVFVFYPIINTIIFSFDETKASGFVFGFGSYKYLFQDIFLFPHRARKNSFHQKLSNVY